MGVEVDVALSSKHMHAHTHTQTHTHMHTHMHTHAHTPTHTLNSRNDLVLFILATSTQFNVFIVCQRNLALVLCILKVNVN